MIQIQGMKTARMAMTGGVDEISPSNSVSAEDFLKLENFRLSKDGRRIQKRYGLTEEVTDFGEDVYGYASYYNGSAQFCQLAILESQIKRKVAAGAWASIHSWSSNIAHPVRPLEINGMQYVITEIQNRMVHYGGSDYQVGIDAPVTLPTATGSYGSTLMSDDMADISDWSDVDTGSGASSQATYDSRSTMRLLNNGSAGCFAGRNRAVTGIGPVFGLEIVAYINTIGVCSETNYFVCSAYNGRIGFEIRFDSEDMYIYDGANFVATGIKVKQDAWVTLKFILDSSVPGSEFIEVYMDNELQGRFTSTYITAILPGVITLGLHGVSVATDAYIDSAKVINRDEKYLSGRYRYAVSYGRSGNFECESNPIKSLIGSLTFVGTGANNLTVTGTYTKYDTKTFKVEIDSATTFKWSEDGGTTWKQTGVTLASSMTLPYGLILAWATTTGRTTGDYWTFTCNSCSITVAYETVTLSSIPTSSDAQVDRRFIYRTARGGSTFYYLGTIYNNTTTTFVDNIPDSALGETMEEDHDVCPVGKHSAYWDNCLWVSGDDIVYYSQEAIPEHFDISSRYCLVQRGDFTDEITGLWPLKDTLYVFRRFSIWAIQKTSTGYGVYFVTADAGCVAPWSIVEVNNILMFISHRGIEAFNGVECSPIELTIAIDRTIKTIDTSKYDYITAVHNKEFREVMWSIPDRTSGSAITLVFHTLNGKWYFFSFYKTPSCLVKCLNSSYALVVKMGTRDGYLDLFDAVYRDGTTNITATARKGWWNDDVYTDIRKLEVEYELPSTMTLTSNIYVNFDKDVFRTASHTGSTPSATDIELRRTIYDRAELGLRGKYFSVEFTNAENLGGDLKINSVIIHYHPRAAKGKVTPD